jgi:DNA polymerase-3 subunit epsilon
MREPNRPHPTVSERHRPTDASERRHPTEAGAMKLPPLAFVDVETTGVDPRVNRITEVGVVTVDGSRMEEWSTVIDPLTRRQERQAAPHAITDCMRAEAPRFRDIAPDLARRLDGRLLVAHNARFDHGFLKAEFDRAGIPFAPQVLCSLMLSRRLYKELAHHDLDSLMASHALTAPVRHRALHDANLVWQLWSHIHRTLPHATVAGAIESLLAGPLLPGHLDPSLIDRLPDAPGVYFFHADDGEVLHAATAGNLKSRVQGYFRLDRISGKALAISHRIRSVTWRMTQGPLGARLQLALSPQPPLPARKVRAASALHSYRFAPDAVPCVSPVALCGRTLREGSELFGAFDSPRKARNALLRIAAEHRLCHFIIGLPMGSCAACAGRPPDHPPDCARGAGRLAQLTRAFTGLRGLRVPRWPYTGPIAIRERRDVYLFDQWQYLGTARSSPEIHDVLEARAPEFDVRMFRLLVKTLPRLSPQRIVPLALSREKRVSPACAVPSSS